MGKFNIFAYEVEIIFVQVYFELSILILSSV